MVVLQSIPAAARWRVHLWSGFFALIGIAALLGSIVHSLELSPEVRARLWEPLDLSLGIAVGVYLTGALGDLLGGRVALRVLPAAVLVGLGFFGLTRLVPLGFLLFILYETVAVLAALAVYAVAARRGTLPGTRWLMAALVLFLIAAAVQRSRLAADFILPLDHNGLFHLTQMIALLLLLIGLRRGMAAAAPVTGQARPVAVSPPDP